MREPRQVEVLAFTVNEFCDAHAIGRTRFYREVRAGRLRTLKAGRRTLVSREDAEIWRRGSAPVATDKAA